MKLICSITIGTSKLYDCVWVVSFWETYLMNILLAKHVSRRPFRRPSLCSVKWMDREYNVVTYSIPGLLSMVTCVLIYSPCSLSLFFMDSNSCTGEREGTCLEGVEGLLPSVSASSVSNTQLQQPDCSSEASVCVWVWVCVCVCVCGSAWLSWEQCSDSCCNTESASSTSESSRSFRNWRIISSTLVVVPAVVVSPCQVNERTEEVKVHSIKTLH